MPDVECVVTLGEKLLMRRSGPTLAPIRVSIERGESALEACTRAVRSQAGFRVSPSLAGIFYEDASKPGDYTLVFVADAPTGAQADAAFEWVELAGLREMTDVPALQREVIPLLLTADSPLAVLVHKEPSKDEAHVRESAPIAPERLSPLVFAVQP